YLKNNSIYKTNIDLMYLTVIYDFENILNYYYEHSKSKYNAVTKSIILLRREDLFNELLSLSKKEKIIRKTKTSKLFKLKTDLLIKMYLYTPPCLTSLFYLSFKKIKELRTK